MGKVTLKVVQKYESRIDGKKNIRLRITANRVSRYIATFINVAPSYFNPKGKRESSNWIRLNHPNHELFNNSLRKLYDRALAVIDKFGIFATADDVKAKLEKREDEVIEEDAEQSLTAFLQYAHTYLTRRGESATTETYANATKAFARFLVSRRKLDVEFADLTVSFVKEWRSWVLNHYKTNTAWLYHSRLKSLYFQALEDVEGLTSLPTVVSDPFRRVKIPKQRTQKVRLYEDEIERLAQLDLTWGSPMRRARDICLMMYYAHGMRVGDALRLRCQNYVIIETGGESEHRLIYIMSKTKKPKNVLLPQQCIDLLAPYRTQAVYPTDTLFPYLKKLIDAGYSPYQLRNKIKSKIVLIRDNLHKMAELTGIDKSISTHMFRHSFADLARRSNLDVMQIKKAMGHEQLNTTQIYMEDLEESAVDSIKDIFRTKSNVRPH
ncbi:tyrosine-type recombinase/integrase [Spirosoma endbachense]|uniref:Tyrosine-type recombinase/integrase n=1 Tax=Spirosoma endbachense TaxID=2666025 RepID=A0A6P1VZU1_9BACT|nr:tyrosine-type recombinase/integrase [Spirosoma endbachense]QHV97290.1 tyrosine-type recombinase/integrase [Spirosoma endbachense]